MQASLVLFVLLTSLVAFLYASVGHGGASGYLALMALFSFPPEGMAASALVLNLLVAGTAFLSFARARFFSWPLVRPFLIFSVPAAFWGGTLKLSSVHYSLLLAGVLFFAAFRLGIPSARGDQRGVLHTPSASQTPLFRLFAFSPFRLSDESVLRRTRGEESGTVPISVSLFLGALIGLISGVVGVGGGIFLSPLLLLLRWAGPKETACASAVFIWVNSLAGLLGRAFKGHLVWGQSPFWSGDSPQKLFLLVLAAFLGGWAGSHLGSRHFSGLWIKRILALALFVASFKLVAAVV